MPDRLSFGPIELTSTPGRQPSAAPPRPEPDTPFKILVLGNFSGRSGHAPNQPRKTFKPVPIDLDNQDEVLAKLDVRLELPQGGSGDPPVSIRFQRLDDFHPDQLVRQIPWFGQVHDLRTQLKHPKTFASAAAQLAHWITVPATGDPAPAHTSTAPAAPSPAPAESTDNMLERLLGKPSSGPTPPPPAPRVDISQLIKNAVQSSIVPGADPRQAELIAAVDAALSSRLNAILHHPQFQALEAAWRAVDLLIKTIELDETISLHLVDASKEDLMQDFTAAGDLRGSWFYQGVVNPSIHLAGSQPWALWVGDYTFGLGAEDASLLAGLGKLAQSAGAPMLAGFEPSALDLWNQPNPPADALIKHWNALRQLPESAYLGLALPRVLLRLPYGKHTDAIDYFPFEEMPARPEAAKYLWGNPAFICACLVGQSFNQSGWELGEGLLCELGGLPMHIYKEDGESAMTPCAEVWLNDLNSEGLLEQGLMPVQSILRRDAVRVPRLQSIRNPLAGLAARWLG